VAETRVDEEQAAEEAAYLQSTAQTGSSGGSDQPKMCIAPAKELAKVAVDNGLSADYIMLTINDWGVSPREAAAVATNTIERGIAQRDDLTAALAPNRPPRSSPAGDFVLQQVALSYVKLPGGSTTPASRAAG